MRTTVNVIGDTVAAAVVAKYSQNDFAGENSLESENTILSYRIILDFPSSFSCLCIVLYFQKNVDNLLVRLVDLKYPSNC